MLDATVQTDRQLSRFFRFLARSVPGGLANVTLVITADHGVAPIAAEAKDAGLPAGIYFEDAIEKATEEFWRAVRKARLRPAPVVRTEAVSEDEDAAG